MGEGVAWGGLCRRPFRVCGGLNPMIMQQGWGSAAVPSLLRVLLSLSVAEGLWSQCGLSVRALGTNAAPTPFQHIPAHVRHTRTCCREGVCPQVTWRLRAHPVDLCVCVHVCVCLRACLPVCVRLRACACVRACLRACVRVRARACVGELCFGRISLGSRFPSQAQIPESPSKSHVGSTPLEDPEH